jgi:uncharacterized protein (DUF433 family)
VRVPVSTLTAWVAGRAYEAGGVAPRAQPLVRVPRAAPTLLTFSNLVESCGVAAIRRKHGVSLQKTRKAIAYVSQGLGVARPLIDESFQTNGIDLFVERYGRLLNVSREGQGAMRDALAQSLERIQWDESGLADRLFPLPRTTDGAQPKPIVIDPRRGFDRPVIAGTGVPTAVIASRYRAGEPMLDLAGDYGLALDLVEDAVRYELRAAA